MGNHSGRRYGSRFDLLQLRRFWRIPCPVLFDCHKKIKEAHTMRRSISVFVVLYALIVTTAFAESTVRKSILAPVQKGITARAPRIAKNTTTGDLLAVWCNSQDDGGCGEILGRFITGNGKVKSASFKVF